MLAPPASRLLVGERRATLVHDLSHTLAVLLTLQRGDAAFLHALGVHTLFVRLNLFLGNLLHLVHLIPLTLYLLLPCPLVLGLPNHLV